MLVNNQSMAGSFQSAPVSTERFDRIMLEIICTGTPTGTVSLQVSNDFLPVNQQQIVSSANWNDIPLSLTALTGGPETYIIDMVETAGPWLRINYVQSGGTGTMNAVITAKES